MFGQPMLEDFAVRIDWHLNKACASGQKAIGSIDAMASATGRYYSGARIRMVFEASLNEFDQAVTSALGELKRISSLGKLEMSELRRITGDRLQNFTARMKTMTKPDKLKEFGPANTIDEFLMEFDTRLS